MQDYPDSASQSDLPLYSMFSSASERSSTESDSFKESSVDSSDGRYVYVPADDYTPSNDLKTIRSEPSSGITRIRRSGRSEPHHHDSSVISCRFKHFVPDYPLKLRYYQTGTYCTLTWDRCEGVTSSNTITIHGDFPSPRRSYYYLILGKCNKVSSTIIMKVGSKIKLIFPSHNQSRWTIYGSSVGWLSD
jgi:hypothetical protein